MARKNTLPVVLDLSHQYTSTSKGVERTVSLAGILDDLAAMLPDRLLETMSNDDGEADPAALVTHLLGVGYWRLLALSDDNQRRARKESPQHLYRTRLFHDGAQAIVEAAREEAAKLAGIALPEVKAPATKRAVPDLDLSESVAQVLAAPVVYASIPDVRAPDAVAQMNKAMMRARKAKPAPAPAPVEVKVIPEGASGKRTRKAKPAPVAAAPVVQAPAPVVQAAAPVVVKAATSSGPAVKVGEYQLTDVVAWLRADLSRSAADAQRHFAALARNRAVNCHAAARA